jgi:hypothetical protein
MKKNRKWKVLVLIVAASAAIAFLILRSSWVDDQSRVTKDAFLYGTIGTEVVPLPVFEVLPDIFPDQFQPAGKDAGDWITQFGFIRGTEGVNEGLPIGFTVSNYQPQSGSPSPVKFVGFSCSACHTNMIRRSERDPGVMVYGMGSTSLDFFGWADALKTAILDENRLTVAAIQEAYRARHQRSLGILENITVRLWLSGIRDGVKATLPKYDAPFGGKDLRNSGWMPIGPGRSQAFRSLVQITMDRPGATDRAYSKLPSIYHQRRREFAQFDGAAKNFVLRSALASLGSGSTLKTLAVPEVLNDIRQASEYSLELNGPRYSDIFKDVQIDSGKVVRGQTVYKQYCADCHGYPGAEGQWVKGARQGQIVPLDEIKTDNQRVSFRYYERISKAVYDYFPDDHPLNPSGDDLRQEGSIGFINAPIESVFARAPYLHNGSVPTLAELINLKPRRSVFYRGSNFYDPSDVGLISPDRPDQRHYYRFDTAEKGNSNDGHDFPWSYKGPGWNEKALTDLLEYLKTL